MGRGHLCRHIQEAVDFVHFVATVRQLGLYGLVLNEAPPV
jgi:hypothetical protein